MSFIKYIADESHYKEVLSLVAKAKRTVWIGTADIKDLYVDDKPFLSLIASLLKKGVEVRLIHAKEPGTAWREDHCKLNWRGHGNEIATKKELRGWYLNR